jgi:hypothetical protein
MHVVLDAGGAVVGMVDCVEVAVTWTSAARAARAAWKWWVLQASA